MKLRGQLGWLAICGVVVVGCASAPATPGSVSDRLETSLFAPVDEVAQGREAELVAECARLNGLDDFRVEAGSHEVVVMDSSPSSGGSGIIQNYLDWARHLDGEVGHSHGGVGHSDSEVGHSHGGIQVDERSEDYAQDEYGDKLLASVLIYGPVAVPGGGESRQGCRAWAAETVWQEVDGPRLEEIGRDYSTFVGARLDASQEILGIEDRWSQCMAESGYPGFPTYGSQMQSVHEMLERLIAGEVGESDALAYDVGVTEAAIRCEAPHHMDRAEIRDRIAEEFMAEHAGVFDGLD